MHNARVPDNQSHNNSRLRLEFFKFNGENPRLWLRKCCRYFSYNVMPDYDKLSLVAMNLEGIADHWFVDYIEERHDMSWSEFTKHVLKRFMTQAGGSLISQFNKLKQTASVNNYIQEFEELRALLKENNQTLNKEYFFESFVGALKKEIGKLVEIQKPTSLLDAIQMALQSEDIVNLLTKGQKMNYKSQANINTAPVKIEENLPKAKFRPIKRLTPEEMKLRHKKKSMFQL